jgi:hypothetical protein
MYFLHQIKNLYANLCEYFEANMKGMNSNKWWEYHSWAMPDYSVTSGTGLNPDARMPMPD